MEASRDILVLPFFGQGHLLPCLQLCTRLSSSYSSKCNPILIIPAHLASSIPSDFQPSLHLLPNHHHHHHHRNLALGIESFLAERYGREAPGRAKPGCVVMDVMMSWSRQIFVSAGIPVASFFTSGACAVAMEHAAWKARAQDIVPGEIRLLSDLPDTMALTYSDLKRRDHRPGGAGRGRPQPPRGGMDFGPPKPGQPPRWLEEAQSSMALLINTCDDLERPFLAYLAAEVRKPVLALGPLLPESYWGSSRSVRDNRPNRGSNYTEDEIIQWLDSKPDRSVIYVSFGSEVGPTMEEYDQLADALRETERSFIWVIQPGSGKPGPPANFFGGGSGVREDGYYPEGLEEEVGKRGLIIRGWAPQLTILSHPSTGGFLSHCGWNSTVEAIGRGIPILAWPIRGDQYYDAKLVVKHLRVGHMVTTEDVEMVKKGDILGGIEKLMEDGEVCDRAVALSGVFKAGFPTSSQASLKALIGLVNK